MRNHQKRKSASAAVTAGKARLLKVFWQTSPKQAVSIQQFPIWNFAGKRVGGLVVATMPDKSTVVCYHRRKEPALAA